MKRGARVRYDAACMSPRLLVLVLCLPALALAAAPRPRIVIDPGHGGTQHGAQGPDGLLEKELALQVARRVGALLTAAVGAEVLLTRERDVNVPLAERVQTAVRGQADLFLSIHANSMPTQRLRARTEGIETFFLSAAASGEGARATADRENAEAPASRAKHTGSTLSFILADLARTEAHADSSRLAYLVHQRLIAGTGAPDRGVQQAPFFVLTGVDVPAILIEVGFISHPAEAKRLSAPGYQEKLALAIAEGVQAYLSQLQKREARERSVAMP